MVENVYVGGVALGVRAGPSRASHAASDRAAPAWLEGSGDRHTQRGRRVCARRRRPAGRGMRVYLCMRGPFKGRAAAQWHAVCMWICMRTVADYQEREPSLSSVHAVSNVHATAELLAAVCLAPWPVPVL